MGFSIDNQRCPLLTKHYFDLVVALKRHKSYVPGPLSLVLGHVCVTSVGRCCLQKGSFQLQRQQNKCSNGPFYTALKWDKQEPLEPVLKVLDKNSNICPWIQLRCGLAFLHSFYWHRGFNGKVGNIPVIRSVRNSLTLQNIFPQFLHSDFSLRSVFVGLSFGPIPGEPSEALRCITGESTGVEHWPEVSSLSDWGLFMSLHPCRVFSEGLFSFGWNNSTADNCH